MRAFPSTVLTVSALTLAAGGLAAQNAPGDLRDELLGHFGRSSNKVEQLSRAMPETLYAWSPGEGVMSVATVYAHIARYNYMYLAENLGIPAPEGVDWQHLESLTEKDAIVEALSRSAEHVRRAVGRMTDEQITGETTLYGRRVAAWTVLVQLVAHMNEHVGQSVAYARMNGVVPPWSR